ncbi:hypothetical protein AWC38_SpisGene7938 [Stylophora pistillata]|uniref:Uncharacterized protein n=1 Tax=Stylophora pistillata TaxID=50429 RepID=A0A2B4SE97_STYPI|nr:hypothetical protein AWC38_SpisGene7938 [Stylophora pistillata]
MAPVSDRSPELSPDSPIEFSHRHLSAENLVIAGSPLNYLAEQERPSPRYFSDDGAPEKNELTISIGSMVCWNFGDWPGADTSLQSWAANELNQAATYPSPYAVRRGKFDPFVSALGAPIGNRDGDVEEGRSQKTLLRVSGIDSAGERARKQEMFQKTEEDLKQCLLKTVFPHVMLASVDTFKSEEETEVQTIQQLARKQDSVNFTTWTVGYAIPYHANLLFTRYRVGHGIVSLQAKEAKHSRLKEDLTLTNRSNKIDLTVDRALEVSSRHAKLKIQTWKYDSDSVVADILKNDSSEGKVCPKEILG